MVLNENQQPFSESEDRRRSRFGLIFGAVNLRTVISWVFDAMFAELV